MSLFSGDTNVPLDEVIQLLLQHVGSMCLHQIYSDLMYTPFGSYSDQQYPVDYTNLDRLCDILDHAIEVGHTQMIVCALIVLQVSRRLYIWNPIFPSHNKSTALKIFGGKT